MSQALAQNINTFSEDDVDTITARMQMIIEEGSDHIKDLELKIKTQGKSTSFINLIVHKCYVR